MSAKKIIAVIGATGAQGGSVVDVFLNDPVLNQEWTVRAVTRDPSKDKAKKLKEGGADVVAADLNDKASLVKAFTGATAVYAVTNYWEIMNMDTEIQQGRNLVDAAKESAVHHFIWSSLPDVKKRKDLPVKIWLAEKLANTREPPETHGKLPHVYQFDGKAQVEEYIREVGIPATFFLPGMYMQSVVSGGFRQTPPHNAWIFSLPMPETAPIPLFDVRNTGIWVKAIVRKRDQLLGKRILGATKYTTPKEVVDGFKQAFPEAGKAASFFSLPHEMFLQGVQDSMGLPDWAAESILEMMRLIDEGGYFGFEPLEESLAVLEDEPTTWVDFLKKYEGFKDLK